MYFLHFQFIGFHGSLLTLEAFVDSGKPSRQTRLVIPHHCRPVAKPAVADVPLSSLIQAWVDSQESQSLGDIA